MKQPTMAQLYAALAGRRDEVVLSAPEPVRHRYASGWCSLHPDNRGYYWHEGKVHRVPSPTPLPSSAVR